MDVTCRALMEMAKLPLDIQDSLRCFDGISENALKTE